MNKLVDTASESQHSIGYLFFSMFVTLRLLICFTSITDNRTWQILCASVTVMLSLAFGSLLGWHIYLLTHNLTTIEVSGLWSSFKPETFHLMTVISSAT